MSGIRVIIGWTLNGCLAPGRIRIGLERVPSNECLAPEFRVRIRSAPESGRALNGCPL